MLAAPESGFVFLATTKTGSTAIENSFARHAQIVARRPVSLKHVNVRAFNFSFAPILATHGYKRGTYELVCVVREPVDWAASWWRYRSRPESAGRPSYTGDMSFDAFAEQIIAGEVDLGSLAAFVERKDGSIGIDRMWRYEHIDKMAEWMAAKIGIPTPPLKPANVSPDRQTVVAPSTRVRLEEFYARHLELYEAAI
jgi:hypothetical protein